MVVMSFPLLGTVAELYTGKPGQGLLVLTGLVASSLVEVFRLV